MDFRSAFGTLATILLVLIAIFVVGSQLFGFPAPISYVATDSMEPQLEPGDGFIGIPKPLAGDVSEGDVITFQAQTVGGGGLTTHRIVDETPQGYITKGDNNPFTDPATGEPPVTEAQIELVVLQLNGKIVVIPNVGDVASSIQSGINTGIEGIGVGGISAGNPGIVVALLGLVLVIGGGIYDAVVGDTGRTTSRSTQRRGVIDSRLLLLAVLLVVSLPLLSITALPSGTDELGILSSERAHPDDPSIIKAGSFSEANTSVENDEMFPMVVIVEPKTSGISFSEQVLTVPPGGSSLTTARIYAPSETGPVTRVRSVTFYLHVLPAGLIGALHSLHPIIARLATMSVILAPVVVVYWLLIGFRPIALREVH